MLFFCCNLFNFVIFVCCCCCYCCCCYVLLLIATFWYKNSGENIKKQIQQLKGSSTHPRQNALFLRTATEGSARPLMTMGKTCSRYLQMPPPMASATSARQPGRVCVERACGCFFLIELNGEREGSVLFLFFPLSFVVGETNVWFANIATHLNKTV